MDKTVNIESIPRVARERKTLEKMICIYCRDHHGTKGSLCVQCEGLRYYAIKKLRGCPFGKEKPVCSKCTVHCYKLPMRELVRTVMRYSGPRMLFHHPILAFYHLWDGGNIHAKQTNE